jgi:acyl-CoA dehydrogenase
MDFVIPEDLKMLQTLARDFVKDQLIPLEKEIIGRETDLEGSVRSLSPEKEADLVKMIKDMGLWGLSIPVQLGGIGLGVLASCLVEEELAKTVVPIDLGDVSPLLFDCNEKQKQEYLQPTLEGQKSAYLALLEPGKGTDPSLIEMKAIKFDDNYILNGTKLVFTKHDKSDFAIVFAVTDSQQGIRKGVTCFLVNSNTDGFTINGGVNKTGWRAQVGEPLTLVFDNCKVSFENVLGEEGKAFQLGKKWLAPRRIIRAARCVGAAVRLLDKAVEHAKSWTSFGQIIAGWPVNQAYLAEMVIDIQAARLIVYEAACKADNGEDILVEAAMAKVFSTQMLKRVADKSILIKNGPGPVQGLPLEFLCRNLLSQNIRERALEVQRSIIAEDLLRLGNIL